MEWGEIATAGLAAVGSAVSGGAFTHYWQARKAQAEAGKAESEQEGNASASFDKRLLLLFTRVASLESKLEAEQALRLRLQEEVLQLQAERNQLRDDLDEAQREALGLKAEVAQLRAQMEGVT